MALMEAAAAGTTIRASDIRGNREVLEDISIDRMTSSESMAYKTILPEKYDIHQVQKTMKRIYEELS